MSSKTNPQRTETNLSEANQEPQNEPSTLDIPEELSEFESESSTSQLLTALKEAHLNSQSELVGELKAMAEDSQKIITEIQGLEGQIEMYQSEIDTWIKTVGEMEAFVEKVKNISEPFEKKCRNMAKLKEYLGGERKRR